MKALYKLEDVGKVYSIGKREVSALREVSLSLPQNGFIAFIGPSGCGKTTLLNLFGMIDKPTSGKIYFDGVDLAQMSGKEADAVRNNDIAFIFQDKNLLSDETVYDNVSLSLDLQGERASDSVVRDALSKVGLPEEGSRKVKDLSGGQSERVAVARAIAKGSKVILCDEPTANLDSTTARSVFQLLKELSSDKLIVVVTHNDDFAREFCDEVYAFKDSRWELEFGKEIPFSDTQREEDRPAGNRRARMRGRVFFRTVFHTITGSKLNFAISVIAFAALFVLFFNIFSLYYYDQTTAYERSFRENDEYVVRLSKYQEGGNRYVLPSGELYCEKLEFLQEETVPSDAALIAEKSLRIRLCNSYFCNLSFKGFSSEEKGNPTALSFYAENFLSLIALESYDSFKQPLVKGRYPKANNEIVIYDYMEESLIRYGIFDDSALNKSLISAYYGVNFQIVGILRSSYKKYLYLEDEPLFSFYGEKMGYEKSYLSELKTIFCLSNYYESIQPALNGIALFDSLTIRSDSEPDITKEMGYQVKKIKNKEEFLGYNWDFLWENIAEEPEISGFAITKETAMAIADITDETDFDNATFNTDSRGSEAFCKSFTLYAKYWMYEKSDLFPAYGNSIYGEFLGIIDEPLGENKVLFITEGNSFVRNGDFKGLYLLLSDNKRMNREMIGAFLQPEKKDDAYYERLEAPVFGLAFYDGNSILINNANDYIDATVKIMKIITIILSVFVAMFMLYYALNGIKNNLYKIGLLKSMGVGTVDLSFLFSSGSFLTFVLGYIVAVPFSFLTMKMINNEFLKSYGLSIPILNAEPRAYGIALLVGMGVLLCGIIYPILKLACSQPIDLIRNERP